MKMKNMLIGGMSLALVACISIGGTLAYLSDTTKVARNTFVMEDANIQLTLREDAEEIAEGKLYTQQAVNYTGEGDNTEEGDWGTAAITDATAGINYMDLLPGDTVSKKPELVLNSGHVPCYVYVSVTNGSVDQTIQNFNSTHWTEITNELKEDGYIAPVNTKIYRYKVNESTNIVPTSTENLGYVFTEVKLDGDATTNTLSPITIKAYAVQSGGDMIQDTADGMAAEGLGFTAPSSQD